MHVMNTLNHIYLYTFSNKTVGLKSKRKVPESKHLDFSGSSDHPIWLLDSLQKHVP